MEKYFSDLGLFNFIGGDIRRYMMTAESRIEQSTKKIGLTVACPSL